MLPSFMHKIFRAPFILNAEELRHPKHPRQTIVLLHGIGSSTLMWHKVAPELKDDVRVIAVDLLGFGKSPHPEWARYDAAVQAASVIATLLRHRVPLGCIIVGHSLGALVAVELTRRAPWYPKRLLLISPPIYKPPKQRILATQQEDILRGIYKIMQRYPKNTDKALRMGKKYFMRLTKQPVLIEASVSAYLASLNASIVNQSTIDHIGDLHLPIHMLSGALDPLVVAKNLQDLATSNENITRESVRFAGHNVVGSMHDVVVDRINAITN